MWVSYRDALRAALLYLRLSVLWLLFTGCLLNRFFDKSIDTVRWQLINGYVWAVHPFRFEGHQLLINTSIGISLFPSDALNAEQSLRKPAALRLIFFGYINILK